MANTNAPYGGAPVGNLAGSPYTGRGHRYYIASGDGNAFYIGDFVISTNTGDANGVPGVTKATAGTETMRGIIIGVEVGNPNSVSIQGLDPSPASANTSIPATKARDYYVLVADSPDLIFTIKGDATATNQTAAKSQYNASLTVAAPTNTSIGNSATVINSSTINTTSSLNIKLMGLVQKPGNAIGAYAEYYAMFNLHELSGSGTTAL